MSLVAPTISRDGDGLMFFILDAWTMDRDGSIPVLVVQVCRCQPERTATGASIRRTGDDRGRPGWAGGDGCYDLVWDRRAARLDVLTSGGLFRACHGAGGKRPLLVPQWDLRETIELRSTGGLRPRRRDENSTLSGRLIFSLVLDSANAWLEPQGNTIWASSAW